MQKVVIYANGGFNQSTNTFIEYPDTVIIPRTLTSGCVLYAVSSDEVGSSSNFQYDAATNRLTIRNIYIPGSILSISSIAANATSSVDIGDRATGNRYSYIDFHSDDTYTDYSFRIIRGNTGANATTTFISRGTGGVIFQNTEGASYTWSSSGNDNMILNNAGNLSLGTTASSNSRLNIKGSTSDNTAYLLNLYKSTNALVIQVRNDGYAGTSQTWQTISDSRLKTNVIAEPYGIDEIMQMNPVKYDFINGAVNQHGFIAQEMLNIVPEIVGTWYNYDEEGNLEEWYSMSYEQLHAIIIAAIKDVYSRALVTFNDIESRLSALEGNANV